MHLDRGQTRLRIGSRLLRYGRPVCRTHVLGIASTVRPGTVPWRVDTIGLTSALAGSPRLGCVSRRSHGCMVSPLRDGSMRSSISPDREQAREDENADFYCAHIGGAECQSNVYSRDRVEDGEVVRVILLTNLLMLRRMLRFGFGSGIVGMLLLGKGLAQEDASKPEFYTAKVKPILDANCARCHGGMNHRGGLSLETRAGMLKGGHDGTVLVPGDPGNSLLVRLIRHEGPKDDPMPMPPNRPKLSDLDIALVTQWVKAGALMPEPVAKF